MAAVLDPASAEVQTPALSLCPQEDRSARSRDAERRSYKPDASDPNDPLVKSLLGARCKASRVLSIELVEQRWNGNDLYKAVCPEKTFFVKVNETLDPAVFTAESGGLVCLAQSKCGLKVPQPFDIGVLPASAEQGREKAGCFLVLSWVEHQAFGAFQGSRMAEFGTYLAKMHAADFKATHQGRYGFASPTWLCTTTQDNTWCSTWEELLRRRLTHSLERALKPRGDNNVAPTDDLGVRDLGLRVLEKLNQLLAPVAQTMQPALLHGELWIGNVLWAKDVGPVLIDPACCFGHAEFDLALMRTFGGFNESCFEAYHAVLPKADGFDARQRVYQAYHRLNLLGTFGNPAEADAAKALMSEVLAAVGG